MTVRSHENGRTREHPVFVRRSTVADAADLARLAGLSGRMQAPRGVYLVAEVEGRTVAAISLDRAEAVLHDPAYETSNVQELLKRWGRNLRRETRRLERRAA
jgi:hypothetical protein